MTWLKLQQHSPQTFLSHRETKDKVSPVKVTAQYTISNDRSYCCLRFQALEPKKAELPESVAVTDSNEQQTCSTPNSAVAEILEFSELHTILKVLPIPAVVFRLADDIVLGANVHLGELFGFSNITEWCNSFARFCFDPVDREELRKRLDQEVTLRNHQVQVRKADQTSFAASVSLQKVMIAGESAVLCTFHDLSAHQRTEEALRQSEARFRTLAETTNTIIFIRQGKQFSYINPAAQIITGYKCEELLECPDINQLIKERGQVRPSNRFFLPQLFPQYEEVKILTKNGSECWLDCSVAVTEFDGKPAILGTAIDITKRKQAETEIRNALAKEKELNELKSHFISMVSHEFRTPLNIISFSASSLKRFFQQWSEEKKVKYLSRIQTNVENINYLLDQILLIGRAEAGKMELQPKAIDLVQFFGDLVTEMQLSDGNNHPIRFNCHSEPAIAQVDEKFLHPILTNLLSNALKYSPSGKPIGLELWIHDQSIVFQVIDQGIGIPIAEQTHLHELFYRGSNVGTTPGSGLGLAVVKKFIEIQNGQITFTSTPGTGTICTVTLPTQSSLRTVT